METIRIPATAKGKVYKAAWKQCVGTGRIGLALQKEYLDALEFVQEEIGFSYIRGHGLLSDDVGIYREDKVEEEVRPFYNFTYVDRIFDSFLELKIRPFVELGFMPEKLASGDQTLFYWRANVTPPRDYGEWEKLIKAVVKHFIARYGLEEVRQWPFEVWNEPNLPGFWKDADMAEYFKLYKVTAHAIKEVDSGLKVGGPAICGGADHWLTAFLDFCHKEQVPVDFVTRHAYTSSRPVKYFPHLLYQDIYETDHMLDELKTVRELIANSPFPDLPFHITEFNTSWSPRNPIHDTVFNAAYLGRILSEAPDYVDTLSYWTFSDVFEENDLPRSLFHGGFGLVALNNIPKPTFHLFSFFARMGEERLYRDKNLLVTRRKDGSIALAAWNPVYFGPTAATAEPSVLPRDLEILIPFPKEEAFIKKQTINEDYGNPLKTWMQMGRPRFPSKGMVETLRQAARPHFSSERLQADDGNLHLHLSLGKNEVTFVEIRALNDETGPYNGLDDSMIGY